MNRLILNNVAIVLFPDVESKGGMCMKQCETSLISCGDTKIVEQKV